MMLKLATVKMCKPAWSHDFIVKSVLLNWQLACCGLFMTLAGLLWMYILRHFPFSMAYPLTSLGFLFGMFASTLVFNETVNYLQWIGVLLIITGCFFVVK